MLVTVMLFSACWFVHLYLSWQRVVLRCAATAINSALTPWPRVGLTNLRDLVMHESSNFLNV